MNHESSIFTFGAQAGLCRTLQNTRCSGEEGRRDFAKISSFFPRCFDLSDPAQLDDFKDDFRQTAAAAVLKVKSTGHSVLIRRTDETEVHLGNITGALFQCRRCCSPLTPLFYLIMPRPANKFDVCCHSWRGRNTCSEEHLACNERTMFLSSSTRRLPTATCYRRSTAESRPIVCQVYRRLMAESPGVVGRRHCAGRNVPTKTEERSRSGAGRCYGGLHGWMLALAVRAGRRRLLEVSGWHDNHVGAESVVMEHFSRVLCGLTFSSGTAR